MIRIAVAFLALALSMAASAKSYTLDVFVPMVLSGTELKPGTYTLDLNDKKIVVKKGKLAVEANVNVDSVEAQIPSTRIRCEDVGGKYQVKEIQLGGTSMKLVIN
jgi:hypothetical protein